MIFLFSLAKFSSPFLFEKYLLQQRTEYYYPPLTYTKRNDTYTQYIIVGFLPVILATAKQKYVSMPNSLMCGDFLPPTLQDSLLNDCCYKKRERQQ